MSYQRNLRKIALNITAAGNTTLVPGGQLGAGIGSIRVWKLSLSAAGANTLTFYSNTTPLPNPQILTAAGSTSFGLQDEQQYYETLPGQSLILNASTGNGVTGELWYSLA